MQAAREDAGNANIATKAWAEIQHTGMRAIEMYCIGTVSAAGHSDHSVRSQQKAHREGHCTAAMQQSDKDAYRQG